MKQTSFVTATVLAAAMSFASLATAQAADADKKKAPQANAKIANELLQKLLS